jgi:hypothetical protein
MQAQTRNLSRCSAVGAASAAVPCGTDALVGMHISPPHLHLTSPKTPGDQPSPPTRLSFRGKIFDAAQFVD